MVHLFRLQLRHARLDGRQAGIGTHHVELIAHARVTQAHRDTARFALVLEVGQGDFFPQLRTPQLTIGIHQLGDHAHPQLVQVRRRGVFPGIAGFQFALDAPEQIDLPGHVQAKVVAIGVDSTLGQTRHLRLALLAADPAGDHRQVVVADVIANGPCGFPAGEGHAQIAVAVKRFTDQLIQRGVIELLPPHRFETRLIVVGPLGRDDMGRRRVRGLVVRPDGAGGQRGDQQTREKQLESLHQCASGSMTLSD
ncbi:hypothetical protein D3C87_1396490 [compost metagenome]